MTIWEPNLCKETFISGTEGFRICNLVTIFVEKAAFKNWDSFSISWIFFYLRKITLLNMLLQKFAACYVSCVHLHNELAWLAVNRLILEERRCQGGKYITTALFLFLFTLHTLNYIYLLSSQEPPTPPQLLSFSTLPQPYGPTVTYECFQYVPAHLLIEGWFVFVLLYSIHLGSSG